jgi:hypothetical protein
VLEALDAREVRAVPLAQFRQVGGRSFAREAIMAKNFTELIAWQLARELKLSVYQLVKHPKMARDFRFIDQITDAAASGPRNIAEGFGRFNRKEFAHFLKIAIASEQ